jgi:transposase
MRANKDKRVRRRAKRLPETRQVPLFPEPLPEAAASLVPEEEVEFLNPSPEGIFLGEVSLRRYLEENDLAWVIGLREELEAADLPALFGGYDRMGRRAIHPVVVLGLVLYGIMERHSSLRALERLAKRDVCAWWLTGGLQPDHSTIGKFINQHADVLTEEFFVSLTRRLCRKLKLSTGTASGDGTVIEAAASHYRTLKADAAREAAMRAPQDARAQEAAAAAAEREAERVSRGCDPGTVRVSAVEPEAVVQRLKNGVYRPSYRPSVLAHESGLIVGQRVERSDETAAVEPMLNQHEAVLGAKPRRTLLDGNYHTSGVLGLFAAWELDVLCPSGTAERGRWEKRGAKGRFGKTAFRYDEQTDEYTCPAGEKLRYRGRSRDRRGCERHSYHGAPCAGCPLRSQCTTAKAGRVVWRYAGDALKEAMTQVLAQPAAQRAYGRRRAMVEPVFAQLRERQGLTRFMRRGLAGVRVEFALHCTAYNLKRTLRLEQARLGLLVALIWTRQALWTLLLFHIRPRDRSGRLCVLIIQKVH